MSWVSHKGTTTLKILAKTLSFGSVLHHKGCQFSCLEAEIISDQYFKEWIQYTLIFPNHTVFLITCYFDFKSLFKMAFMSQGRQKTDSQSVLFSIQSTILKTSLGALNHAWWLGNPTEVSILHFPLACLLCEYSMIQFQPVRILQRSKWMHMLVCICNSARF